MSNKKRTTRAVFEEWGQIDRADRMADHHWATVKQAFDMIKGGSGNYLEIGVGNGYGIEYLSRERFSDGHCWGFDLAESMVERAKKMNEARPNVTLQQGDFLSLDFSDYDPFDLIFSMEVFYYFQDIQQGIDKSYSILQPGGELWVLVNFFEENSHSHGWPDQLNTSMKLWSKKDYADGFQKSGFRQVEQHIFYDNSPDGDGPTLATRGIK